MPERKLSKRQHVILTESPREQTAWDQDNNKPIYTEWQHFRLGYKHGKRSDQPVGWFQSSNFGGTLNVRWLWTESNGHFAPEFTLNGDNPQAITLAAKVGRALCELERSRKTSSRKTPEALVEALKATVVEYVEGAWATYKPLRVPGENAMLTLARAAREN